jgi:hypothetical protein
VIARAIPKSAKGVSRLERDVLRLDVPVSHIPGARHLDGNLAVVLHVVGEEDDRDPAWPSSSSTV